MIDGYTTETRAGAHGPVVVRTATTDIARMLLAQEADRLGRARHPGVVELLEATPDQLTISWAGAQTLELLAAPVPVLCGVLTSVASTVADLHEIGIIHGRLDASHVVLDGDGRPRLCGMRGSAPDEPVALPTDDVAAIGSLIDHLMGPDTEPEPIPERRWSRRRWTGYQRRALQLLADRAVHEDPARRPTARELAAAIAEAVPHAQLPTPTPSAPPTPSPVSDPTATAARTTPDTASTPEIEEVSPTTGPPESPHPPPRAAAVSPLPTPPPSPPPPAVPPAQEVAAPRPAESPTPPPVGAIPAPPPKPTFLGMRVEAPPTNGDARIDAPPAAPPVAPPNEDRRRNEDRPGNHRLRAVHPTSPHPRPVRTARVAILVLVLAVLGAVAVGVLVTRDNGPADTAIDPTPTTTIASTPADDRPTPASAPSTCTAATTGGSPDSPDLDGDGCPDPVEVDGTRVTADGVTFEVGEQGDQVRVADWNCDGRATPAVVRPGTGEIFVFSQWVEAGAPVSETPATVVPGAVALVEPAAGPCPTHHLVRVVGGTTVPVDLEVDGP